MKKVMMTTMALFVACMAQADDFAYPYLTFQTADGIAQSLPASQLTMTVADGQLTVSSTTGDKIFALASLAKMYFTETAAGSTVTKIDSLPSADGREVNVEVYTPSGIYVGTYPSLSNAKGSLRSGIYVVKTGGQTFKTAVK